MVCFASFHHDLFTSAFQWQYPPSVSMYKVERCILAPRVIHSLNQHDPGSAWVHNSFALVVY